MVNRPDRIARMAGCTVAMYSHCSAADMLRSVQSEMSRLAAGSINQALQTQPASIKRSASSIKAFSPIGASLEPNGIWARSFQCAGIFHSAAAAASTTGL